MKGKDVKTEKCFVHLNVAIDSDDQDELDEFHFSIKAYRLTADIVHSDDGNGWPLWVIKGTREDIKAYLHYVYVHTHPQHSVTVEMLMSCVKPLTEPKSAPLSPTELMKYEPAAFYALASVPIEERCHPKFTVILIAFELYIEGARSRRFNINKASWEPTDE